LASGEAGQNCYFIVHPSHFQERVERGQILGYFQTMGYIQVLVRVSPPRGNEKDEGPAKAPLFSLLKIAVACIVTIVSFQIICPRTPLGTASWWRCAHDVHRHNTKVSERTRLQVVARNSKVLLLSPRLFFKITVKSLCSQHFDNDFEKTARAATVRL
jgi:hypothetical protein